MKRRNREQPGPEEIPPIPRITREIVEKLGELGINDLPDGPRKTKKAVVKAKKGKALGSQELARLAALRRRSEQ